MQKLNYTDGHSPRFLPLTVISNTMLTQSVISDIARVVTHTTSVTMICRQSGCGCLLINTEFSITYNKKNVQLYFFDGLELFECHGYSLHVIKRTLKYKIYFISPDFIQLKGIFLTPSSRTKKHDICRGFCNQANKARPTVHLKENGEVSWGTDKYILRL